MKNLKQRIRNGELLHGNWINLGSPVAAEIVGKAGFDWVVVDQEHGPGTESETLLQLQALESGTAAALVRVESYDRLRISRILDLGAEGIVIPQVKTVEEVKAAVSAMYYPPHGIRGIATMTWATHFGEDAQAYFQTVKDRIVGIIQIETTEILSRLDEVAKIEGVDVLFVGPADLSLNLGIFQQFDHPAYLDAIAAIAKAAARAGKALGVLFSGMEYYDMYYDYGFRFIACGADSSYIVYGTRQMLAKMNEKKGNKKS